MAVTPGRAAFQLAFVVNPIFLTGGIASSLGGGTIPIMSLTQSLNFSSLISPGGDIDLDDVFASFHPLPGGSLISNELGTYPFANQMTAGNAIITQPLNLSMMMICPARAAGDYARKGAIISALKATLDQHNISGGTYTVLTPSFPYTDCVMVGMQDASDGASHQAQFRWRLDFRKPLISLQEAAQSYNNLMGRIGGGLPVTPNANGEITFSNLDITVGNPNSVVPAEVIPPNTPLSSFSGPSNSVFPTSIPGPLS